MRKRVFHTSRKEIGIKVKPQKSRSGTEFSMPNLFSDYDNHYATHTHTHTHLYIHIYIYIYIYRAFIFVYEIQCPNSGNLHKQNDQTRILH